MELYNPSVIRRIKNRYGFQFSKSLGQNFLIDKGVIDRIVDGAGITEDDMVIEIGPGIGVLTRAAAEKAGKVIAIEIDTNLMTILEDTLSGFDNIKIINENVLKLDLVSLINQEARGYKSVKVIGNLPYYITTAIIMKLLEERLSVESITIMMQKEVADRIKSAPGSRIYGAISVAVQYYCEVNVVEDVPKKCFMPMPKVDSTVLRLDIRKEPAVELLDEKMFFRCIKAGFSQRRKTLLNSLTGTGFEKGVISKCLESAGIDSRRRAETLSLSEFASAANELVKEGKR
ncbi:MAG: 16S rRNA (adenine(1518)-N(6)/adenine(1519)-N(6))-dimethyltransferase RsmA [Hornefia sp.]|nr:16S rRNA (adenine(1518)-N(6)/adenine(1519)-N(6))-dimethyltransferase RsmA [Hornefia sp.]